MKPGAGNVMRFRGKNRDKKSLKAVIAALSFFFIQGLYYIMVGSVLKGSLESRNR